MDILSNFRERPKKENEWVVCRSELTDIEGKQKDIKIALMEDGMPRAVAFFDIDGTLAHLDKIHGKAIRELFKVADGDELEETYYKGFKLGNSFREFDRMKGIYEDGHTEWKDPEVYLKERYTPNAAQIDEPGNLDHNIAAGILKAYGEIAARITEELYKSSPEEFERSNIAPIFHLARMYARLGIPMVGFTANAKVFVDKLSKYLKLSDIFIDIATDETMKGGGKEVAINQLMSGFEKKGIKIPKGRLIFVGDSLIGDIGTSLKVKGEKVSGKGVLVLEDREALLEIEKQISEDPNLRHIADSIDVSGFVVGDVPLDEKGSPMLLSRFREQFLKKL